VSRKNGRKYGIESGSSASYIIRQVFIVVVILLFAYILANHEGIPTVLIICGALVGLYSFIGNRTTLGRRIYATGGNESATLLSGVNTRKIRFLVFANMGIMSAVAGIVYTARLNYATPTAGSGFELDAIAACFIGGASARGGTGTLQGAIIGALIMGILNNGMSLMGLGVDVQQSIKGLVLIFAVAFDVVVKSKSRLM
jgi:putative multiple sugar transport system permease protein